MKDPGVKETRPRHLQRLLGGVQSLHFPKKKCTFEKASRVDQQGINGDEKVLEENTVKDELEGDKVMRESFLKRVSWI